MPSGPRKRQAARRRRDSVSPGLSVSAADKESVSGSHASDEGTSQQASDEVTSRLSLDIKDRPADQTFHTEEWVRVSDFDVDTPTSKGDYDASTEDSYSEARRLDKLGDWETVSRGTVGNSSSSAEDIGEGDHLGADESSATSQEPGPKLSQVNEVRSASSSSVSSLSSSSGDEEDNTGKGTKRENSSSSKKVEGEDRLSSIILIPSPHGLEDEGQDSISFEEVPSEEDEDHGSLVDVSLPEEQEDESHMSSIVDVLTPEELEDDKDEANHILDASSSEEKDCRTVSLSLEEQGESQQPSSILSVPQDEDSNRVTSIKEKEEDSRDISSTEDHQDLNNQISSVLVDETPSVGEEVDVGDDNSATGQKEQESHHQQESSDIEVIKGGELDIHSSAETAPVVEDLRTDVEPKPSNDTEEGPEPKTRYEFIHSISGDNDEEASVETLDVLAPEQKSGSGSLEGRSSDIQVVNEKIAKETHDEPLRTGVPEAEQEHINQLLEIVESKEMSHLAREEEKLVSQEEEHLGKGIADLQPLTEILASADNSPPLEGGALSNLQPVAVESTPLVEDMDMQSSPESVVPKETESDKGVIESCDNTADDEEEREEGEQHDSTNVQESGMEGESFASIVESSSSGRKEEDEQDAKNDAPEENPPAQHQKQDAKSTDLSSEKEETLAALSSSESLKSFTEPTKHVEPLVLSGKGLSIGGSGESPYSWQHRASPRKPEEQGRGRELREGTSELRGGGCCEPVQWLFGRLFGAQAV
jgi:hypothetical protein